MKVVLFETKVAGTKQTLKNGSYRLFLSFTVILTRRLNEKD